jgi:very-short-patch-repair endonuclease
LSTFCFKTKSPFYCPSEKLAIELDGAGHYTVEGIIKDEIRTQFLNEVGIKVLRFENKLVFEKTEWVLEEISKSFAPPHPTDTPPRKEGS